MFIYLINLQARIEQVFLQLFYFSRIKHFQGFSFVLKDAKYIHSSLYVFLSDQGRLI